MWEAGKRKGKKRERAPVQDDTRAPLTLSCLLAYISARRRDVLSGTAHRVCDFCCVDTCGCVNRGRREGVGCDSVCMGRWYICGFYYCSKISLSDQIAGVVG